MRASRTKRGLCHSITIFSPNSWKLDKMKEVWSTISSVIIQLTPGNKDHGNTAAIVSPEMFYFCCCRRRLLQCCLMYSFNASYFGDNGFSSGSIGFGDRVARPAFDPIVPAFMQTRRLGVIRSNTKPLS